MLPPPHPIPSWIGLNQQNCIGKYLFNTLLFWNFSILKLYSKRLWCWLWSQYFLAIVLVQWVSPKNTGKTPNECRRMYTSEEESLDECKWIKNKFCVILIEASQDRCFLICCRFLPKKHRWMKKFVLRCNRCLQIHNFLI